MGQHWVQDCPTQGDPNYDRKRVRPPVGIPMTRLALSEEGGLVLPGGQTGTLVANEDAFAREILGLPGGPAQQQQQQAAAAQQQQAAAPVPVLLLDNKPAAEGSAVVAAATAVAPAVKAEPGTALATAPAASAAAAGVPPLIAAAGGPAPLLAGEAELAAAAPFAAMPAAGFFTMFMQSALMPRGPPDFLRLAFDRDAPMARAGALATRACFPLLLSGVCVHGC